MGLNRREERGQAIVILAIAMVVLLVAAGMAIDGGVAHLNRRRAQNAADAGALAGARVLSSSICDSATSSATDTAVYAAVWDYARRNGVTDANNFEATYVRFANNVITPFDPPAVVGNGSVPSGATGVAVTTTLTQSTYFMGLVGQNETNTGASATAVTGPPLLMGGLRPFGVSLEVMSALDVGDCFTSDFKNCGNANQGPCYILDDDGNRMSQHRGWLNLNHVWNAGEADEGYPRASGGSGSANDLKTWMEEGWGGTLYADCFWSTGCHWGDFIHAKPGTNSSAIGATPIDELFFIPIFDAVPEYETIPAPKAGAVAQGGNYYYHIVGFTGVIVPSSHDVSQGGGTIRTCIQQVIWGQGQPSPNSGYGGGACASHVMVVTLWE
ncbi:MAG: hypothetical protein JXD18_00800 [Anaerolineae bacterium]|nr:hypothetical protein [Anaerolineae bacterium]